jgi:hypothetical protein
MPGDVRLELGGVLVTAAAVEALCDASVQLRSLLERHAEGEWGNLSDEARNANERALRLGGEVGSVYRLPNGEECLVMTEIERALTVVLTAKDLPVLLEAAPGDRGRRLREEAGALPPLDIEWTARVGQEERQPSAAPRPRAIPDPPV